MTGAFVLALLAGLMVQMWLAARQMRHVLQHRAAVPETFAATVSLQAHQKAADYTLARNRFGLVNAAFAAAVLVGWTLLGGLDALNVWLRDALLPGYGAMAYQMALVGAVLLIGALLELPLSWYSTFRLEARFGFNHSDLTLWLLDLARGLGLGVVLGAPLLALVLWIMDASGGMWWWWAWLAWSGFNLLLLWIYPGFIAPLFNKFTPLQDEGLRERVQALMHRCGFAAKGLFVMDGSRRSAHSNAYFTGLGRSKRVVFYDTLLARLSQSEVEAVLAHELGHFRHRHVQKHIVTMLALSLAGLALLGWLAVQSGFYAGLGVRPNLEAPNDALALTLFMMVLPTFTYFISPLAAQLSRRHEFQADAFACAQADGRSLASALLKLHEDNASTLTPDPLYACFYYSHPPALQRLAALPAATS